MREMVRDAREYELKALLTDLFGARGGGNRGAAAHKRGPDPAAARSPDNKSPSNPSSLRPPFGNGSDALQVVGPSIA